jgi:hypothetical protein
MIALGSSGNILWASGSSLPYCPFGYPSSQRDVVTETGKVARVEDTIESGLHFRRHPVWLWHLVWHKLRQDRPLFCSLREPGVDDAA